MRQGHQVPGTLRVMRGAISVSKGRSRHISRHLYESVQGPRADEERGDAGREPPGLPSGVDAGSSDGYERENGSCDQPGHPGAPSDEPDHSAQSERHEYGADDEYRLVSQTQGRLGPVLDRPWCEIDEPCGDGDDGRRGGGDDGDEVSGTESSTRSQHAVERGPTPRDLVGTLCRHRSPPLAHTLILREYPDPPRARASCPRLVLAGASRRVTVESGEQTHRRTAPFSGLSAPFVVGSSRVATFSGFSDPSRAWYPRECGYWARRSI